MRKAFLFTSIAILGVLLSWNLYHLPSAQKVTVKEEANEEEAQDGILLAQQMEFEITKDVSLGYVPKYRLINAYEDLLKTRRQRGSNNRVSALVWTERGPNTDVVGPGNGNTRAGNAVTSGRMRAIWVDLADGTNKTVWVGGINGGIWKTNDITASPATWTLVNDFLGNMAIGSICQDPNNTNIMYVGTGEKAINADAVRGGGVWKSTDHGVTWNLLANTTGFWNVSKILCDGSGNVYVTTIGNNAGIQRSTDGGGNWIAITPAGLSLRVTEMKLSSTGRMHIVCGYTLPGRAPDPSPVGYRFTDNPSTVTSATWTSAATNFASPQYNTELCVAGNTLYALVSNSSYQTTPIYKSIDGGANWAPATTSPPAASGTFDLSSGQAWYNLAIGVDPDNPDNVIAGGLNCYRSTNGGDNWSRISGWFGTSGQYIHADQHTVIWNGNQVLVGTDGGIFYSADGGTTFTDRNVNLPLKQFYSVAIHPTSPNYFLGGTQDNGCHQLNNPGLGGSVEVTGGDGAFMHIDQDEPQYQFGSYVFSQYRRSTNSGAAWSNVNYSSSTGQFINPTDYDDINNKMYTSGGSGQFIRWENPQTGNNFSPVSIAAFNSSTVRSLIVSPYTPNRVFFGTSGGRIVRVDNANLASPTATNITSSSMNTTTVSCIAVGTTDNNLLATFSNFGSTHVWVSTTGGGAGGWSNISGTSLPDIPVRWAMFYPEDNTTAMIGTDLGVWETSNINGASTVWVQHPNFPVVRVDMLQYRSSDGLVAAGTHGRGIWSALLPFTFPYVRFPSPYNVQSETTVGTSGCRGYKDYVVNMKIDMPPTGNANVTLSVAGGATAKQGIDFDFTTNGNFASPSHTLTFTSGSSSPQPVTIRIYNDDDVESTESFTLNYSIGGATNAKPAPSSLTYAFYIKDKEMVSPVAAAIGFGNANFSQPFRGEYSDARTQMVYTASDLTSAGFSSGIVNSIAFNVLTKGSSGSFDNFTVKLKNTSTLTLTGGAFENDATTVYGPASYTTVLGTNTITITTPFLWDGTSNLLIDICFDNVVPPSASGSNDMVAGTLGSNQCHYSWDLINPGCLFTTANFTFGGRPNVTLNITPTGIPVETSIVTRDTYLGPYSDIYAYSINGNIIARIKNLSNHNYGCTQVKIDRAGPGSAAFWNDNMAYNLINKTFQIVPTTNNASGEYQITLYYTQNEVQTWEAATGQEWNNIQLIKVDGQISQVTPGSPYAAGRVETVVPLRGTFGNNYTLTYTFTTGFSGFGAGVVGFPLPFTLLEFKGKLQGENVMLDWITTAEYNSKHFEIEKSYDGIKFRKLRTVPAAGNSSVLRRYDYLDSEIAAEANYYRLKMMDNDGNAKISQVILIRNQNVKQRFYVLTNPFHEYIDIRLARIPKGKVKIQLIDLAGKLWAVAEYTQAASAFRFNSYGKSLSNGVYILQADVDGKKFVSKVVKQ